MALRLGINGFGRIGRLALRAAWDWPELEIVHINNLADAATAAHLLEFDSVHGRWPRAIHGEGNHLLMVKPSPIQARKHWAVCPGTRPRSM